MSNLVIWDIETDSSQTDYLSILEIGGLRLNDRFQELDRFHFRCRIPEGVIPQAAALLVNRTSVQMLTQSNLSHYQMMGEIEKIFTKWSPATFIGFSNINFDDEAIRKEFFKGLRYPYITNSGQNNRHDGLNIIRAAYAVNKSIFKTENNKKGNAVMKLESLCRNNGIDTSGAHSALFDANLTKLLLEKIYREQNITWRSALENASRVTLDNFLKKGEPFTLNEYFYGKSRLYLCCPLHADFTFHPTYRWGVVLDLRFDVKPLLGLSVSALKLELKKSPKFLRTVRTNKAPVILHPDFGKKVEPYNVIKPEILRERIKLTIENQKFAENICTALKEIAEEKQETSSQEDIVPEESIYKIFKNSQKDRALMPKWHDAEWKDKLETLDKFEDDRLKYFGQKIIYREAPEVLPASLHKKIKREIASRILSEKKEKWWTCKEFYYECDNFRAKYTDANDHDKLKFLDELNQYVESVEKKYQNA